LPDPQLLFFPFFLAHCLPLPSSIMLRIRMHFANHCLLQQPLDTHLTLFSVEFNEVWEKKALPFQ
jgi:hypothetical protein